MASEITRIGVAAPVTIKLRPAVIVGAMLLAAGLVGGWLLPHTKTIVVSQPPALTRSDDYATRHLAAAADLPRAGMENPALYAGLSAAGIRPGIENPALYAGLSAVEARPGIENPALYAGLSVVEARPGIENPALYEPSDQPPRSYLDDEATRHLGG